MQLKYRGVQYQSLPVNLAIIEENVIGKYRGATLKAYQYTINPSTNQPTMALKYRGISYPANAMAQVSFA